MLDYHSHPADWGVRPILFSLFGYDIKSYAFFVLLGLIVGLGVYLYLARKEKKLSENSIYIILAGLAGGIIGAKVVFWIIYLPALIQSYPDLSVFLSGRSIIGGLIGGTLAVMLVKWKLGIKTKMGNLFAPGIALGVAIGRIGCLLQGCCYGTSTTLPWGVDFGDAIFRHPTQIYEAIFMLGMFFFLMYKRKDAKPGQLFYLLMNCYFVFRFFEEFIRDSPSYLGLTVFQYLCLLALAFINAKYLYEKRKR